MILPSFIIPISSLSNFILGWFVYSQKKKNEINISFAIFTWMTAVWGLTFLFYENPLIFSSKTWIKITYFSTLVMIPSFFYFSFVFPDREKEPSIFYLILYSILFVFFVWSLFFSDLFIKDVLIKEGRPYTLWGPAYWLYNFVAGYFAFLIFYNLFRKFVKSKGIVKLQLKYVFLGVILLLISAIIVDLVIPLIRKTTQYFWLTSVFTLFFTGFTTLAITKYHLFGIEVILIEILVGVIGILLVIQIFTAPTVFWKIANGGIFILFFIFGYLLIKGVFREIERKKEAEKMAQKEKKLRKEAEKLIKETEALARAKDQFLLSIQHHLRTPLTPILGYLEMILEGDYGEIDNQKIKEKLIAMKKSAETLHSLLEDFLDIHQLKLGKQILNLTQVNIDSILAEIFDELTPIAKSKNLEFSLTKENLPEKILADEKRLKEAIFNIVDNAIKYTEKGKVKIEAKGKEKSILITVSDTGIGMEKEEIAYFSEGKMFERGKEAREKWGLGRGIGLAVAIEFIKAHKGKIKIESEGKGKGTKILIEIPINKI